MHPTEPQGAIVRIMKLPEVMNATSLSRSTIYAFIKLESFPAPIPLGGRAVGWLEAEINAWIETRVNNRMLKSKEMSDVA